MAVVRLMLKVVLLPVLLIVTLAEWIGIFLTSFVSVLFYLFAGLCFILAVFSYLAGISTGSEAMRMLAICFDEEIKVTLERIETIRENMTDLILKNAADEIYEDLYSLNDNEPWFYPEFMARHSVFAKTLYRLLQQCEEKHCCGCCKHKGAANGKGGCSCGD